MSFAPSCTQHRPPSEMTQFFARTGQVHLPDRHPVLVQQERTDFRSIVKVAIEGSHQLIERRRHELLATLPDEQFLLLGNPEKLEIAVSHLLDNAARYTPDGGCIWVQLTREGDTAVLKVRDSGQGITGELLACLFDFVLPVGFAGHKEGFGIGLAIAKRLVDLHGGSLRAESLGPGCGADFTLRLPALVAESSPTANENETATAELGNTSASKPKERPWLQTA
jgi:signal transduction histidine kinase